MFASLAGWQKDFEGQTSLRHVEVLMFLTSEGGWREENGGILTLQKIVGVDEDTLNEEVKVSDRSMRETVTDRLQSEHMKAPMPPCLKAVVCAEHRAAARTGRCHGRRSRQRLEHLARLDGVLLSDPATCMSCVHRVEHLASR